MFRSTHPTDVSMLPLVITAEKLTATWWQKAVNYAGNFITNICDLWYWFIFFLFKTITCKTQQMLHVAVCAYVPSLTHSSLQQKQGLPLLNQIISWSTLGRWTGVTRPRYHKAKYCTLHRVTLGFFMWYIFSHFGLNLRVFNGGSVVKLHSTFPSTPQHIPLTHCHIPAAQHWVRHIQ